MLVRYFWPDCDYRGKILGAAPADAFWVEATQEEAEISIFPRLKSAVLAESKKLAEGYSHLAALEAPPRPYCYLVARDLSFIDPFHFHYPFHHLWNAYSPFEPIGPLMISGLDELHNIQLPPSRSVETGAGGPSCYESSHQDSTGTKSEIVKNESQ